MQIWAGSRRSLLQIRQGSASVMAPHCEQFVTWARAAVAFAEYMAVTYGDAGVKVTCLCPQGVNTAMLHAGDDEVSGSNVVKAAGIVLGAKVPIILTSRADSVRTRHASAATAVLSAISALAISTPASNRFGSMA